jgi:peptidoglycan hydrolase CwlO-like protein
VSFTHGFLHRRLNSSDSSRSIKRDKERLEKQKEEHNAQLNKLSEDIHKLNAEASSLQLKLSQRSNMHENLARLQSEIAKAEEDIRV